MTRLVSCAGLACAVALVCPASAATPDLPPVPEPDLTPNPDATPDPDLAPAGYFRDAEGRTFQVVFDLNQRFWIGGGYVRSLLDDEPGAGTLETGFRVDVPRGGHRGKDRFRFLEYSLTLDRPRMVASLFRWDSSNRGDEPFVRLSTFIGGPARHDLYLQGGGWLDLLGVDHLPRGTRHDAIVRVLAGGFTWDWWHDDTMTSFLRLKLGGAIDDAIRIDPDRGRFSIVPIVALEGDFTLDGAGFYHLTLSSRWESPFTENDARDGLDRFTRFDNELAWEMILLALDDQPLSLRLSVSGGYRDDLAEGNGWDLAAGASLRFSLWAPPGELPAARR